MDKLDRQIEEFKSKKEKHGHRRLKVQKEGWKMVVEIVRGMLIEGCM